MKANQVRAFAPLGCRLGEAPLWHPEEQQLYCVDIEEKAVWSLHPGSGDVQNFPLGMMVSCLGIRKQGGFVLAGERGFALWDPGSGTLESLSQPEAERPHARFNDGAVDPGGRFWAGSMTPTGNSNSLYRLDPDHTVHRMETGIGISNGIGWSPDRSLLYFTDSPRKLIYAYDYDFRSGLIGNRRIWIDSREEAGVPDGLCIDSEGCLWSARWDGWRVTRYDPEGLCMLTVPMPVQRPTSCAFGGADLKTLFITSAWSGLSSHERKDQPHAGDLFMVETDVSGQAPNHFDG